MTAYDDDDARAAARLRDDVDDDADHPVGTGLGAAGGALTGVQAGAIVGSVGGPVGAAVGAVAGAIVGGVAGGVVGSDLAEWINPKEVDTYWEQNYRTRPYVAANDAYTTYSPAYRYGAQSYGRYANDRRSFDEVEGELRRDWESNKEYSSMNWDRARQPIRDSYDWAAKTYPLDEKKTF